MIFPLFRKVQAGDDSGTHSPFLERREERSREVEEGNHREGSGEDAPSHLTVEVAIDELRREALRVAAG